MTRDRKAELARFVDDSQIGLWKDRHELLQIRTSEFCVSYHFSRRLGRDRTLTENWTPDHHARAQQCAGTYFSAPFVKRRLAVHDSDARNPICQKRARCPCLSKSSVPRWACMSHKPGTRNFPCATTI